MSDQKNIELANTCVALRSATSEALSWLESNTKLVGNQYDSLLRELKLASVEARKLSRASQRPTSLAIFGPSQVGKSFLTGTLLLGDGQNDDLGKVVFTTGADTTRLNFLTEVNPSGGQETTGLVTRFTTTNDVSAPNGFPVCLRLMSEIDLVKILANSFVEDLNIDAEVAINESSAKALLEKMRAAVAPNQVDVLAAEDIYELEHYIRSHLNAHPYSRDLADLYWDNAAGLAPYLKIHDRAELYSLLWGGITSFTSLFIELKEALDKLEHPEWGFVSLDAITDRMPGKTVLHVLTMKHGLADDLSQSEMGRIALADGRSFDVRKPVITALASEMRAQLENTCWDFFENTDLLDFPGARSRERVKREKFFNTEKEPYPIGDAFLRGKVAVLFDNYSADLDLNTLVACHKAEQNSVTSFKHLVESWVNRTHGNTPEARANSPVNLFMAVTWCDTLFDESFGQEKLDLSLDNKLSYLKNFCPSINQWTPDSPFNNTFLIRNPAGKRFDSLYNLETSSESAEWKELSYREDAKDKLANYKNAFLQTEVSQKYFDDQSNRWEAMTTPNDGGVTLLAQSLTRACNPDVKYAQLNPKQNVLKKSLQAALNQFYEGDDIAERVKKRTAAVEEVIQCLSKNISLVPKFISQFHLQQKPLRELYVDYRHKHLFGVADGQEERETVGEVVVKSWLSKAEKVCEDELKIAQFRVTRDHVRTIITELEVGLRTANAAQAITERVSKIEQYSPGSTKHADYIATAISLLMNDFVNFAGCGDDLPGVSDADNPVFKNTVSLDNNIMPVLKENTVDMSIVRNQYTNDWFDALRKLTHSNASSAKGSVVNIEENQKLGNILAAVSH